MHTVSRLPIVSRGIHAPPSTALIVMIALDTPGADLSDRILPNRIPIAVITTITGRSTAKLSSTPPKLRLTPVATAIMYDTITHIIICKYPRIIPGTPYPMI